MKNIMIFGMVLIMNLSGLSQNRLFEPKEFLKAYENGTRTRNGIPGAKYWQNTINYQLKAELDPANSLLKGTAEIRYINNSPDTLRYMVIKMLPNIHKRGSARDYAVGTEQLNDGMILDSLAMDQQRQPIENHKKFIEYGTNLYVIFDESEGIAPHTEKELFISWNYEVVRNGIRNGAFSDSAFFIGYWYPQIAVYDDVYGWDREDYTGNQETYNELGIYEVEITVPEDYVVWATGDQLNENDIFSDATLQLINKSRKSDKTIHIITEESYTSEAIFKDNQSHIWKFKAENVPDFAWACSNYYYWDANSIQIEDDGKRNIWVNAAYPPGAMTFDNVADIAHQSIDYLSNIFPGIPYPFNKHITFNGIQHIAVEYPMIANNSDQPQEEMYTELTIHEIAHNYIPFYMLANERKNAWIDEGWVKLIGELYGETLGLMREDKTVLNTVSFYEKRAGSSNDLPLIVPSGFMTVRDNFYHSYAKAANANMFLLVLMDEKGIENPLKSFVMAWKHKHPTPYDFFNFMNNLCGEDLSWYWSPWYFEFSTPDLKIAESKNHDEILVINWGGIPLPIKLTITYNDQSEKEIEMSIWNWADGVTQVPVRIKDISTVKNIKLGSPEIPDINDTNNTLTFHDEDLGKLN